MNTDPYDFDSFGNGSSDQRDENDIEAEFVRTFLANTSLTIPRDRVKEPTRMHKKSNPASKPRAPTYDKVYFRKEIDTDDEDEGFGDHELVPKQPVRRSRQNNGGGGSVGGRRKRVERLVQVQEEEAMVEQEPVKLKRSNKVPLQNVVPKQKVYIREKNKAIKGMENMSGGMKNNQNFIYKVLVLVFAILTAVSAGGWAVVSSTSKKRGRRTPMVWAWITAICLFLTMIMICLLIAFPATISHASTDPITLASENEYLEDQEVGTTSPRGQRTRQAPPLSKQRNNPGPEFNNIYQDNIKPDHLEVDTWTARQRQQGHNLRNLEGPRGNYRHRPEIDETFQEGLVPNEEIGISKEDYGEYMRRLQGYNDPADIQRYPYMPNAAQFEYEAHLDDAETQHGIAGQPGRYLSKSRMRDRKMDQSEPDRNSYNAPPGGYVVPTSTHPWMDMPSEDDSVAKIFETTSPEHASTMSKEEYESLLDVDTEEMASSIEQQRKEQDAVFFPNKLGQIPVSSGHQQQQQSIKLDANGNPVLPPALQPISTLSEHNQKKQQLDTDANGNVILPSYLQPVETQRKKPKVATMQGLLANGGGQQNQLLVRPQNQQQQQQPEEQLQVQTMNFQPQDENDPFNQAFNDPKAKDAAEAFAASFQMQEVPDGAELAALIAQATSRG